MASDYSKTTYKARQQKTSIFKKYKEKENTSQAYYIQPRSKDTKAWKRSFHLFHSAFIFFCIENLLYPISKDELSDHLIYTKLKEPFCKPKTKF